MLVIPGQPGKDLCDSGLGITRRDLLRVGGSAVLGLTCSAIASRQRLRAKFRRLGGGPGWGSQERYMLYLQGGPSYISTFGDPEWKM